MLDDINRPPDSPTDYEMQRLQPSHKKPRTRSLDDDDSNASYDELVPFPSATTLGSNTSSNTNTTSKYHVSCLYNSCKAFYLFSIACLIAVATTLLIVYPTAPIYNICSDEMDWKSIVDGMASLKLQTNYQLLVSIYNPNYFSAEILSGTGTFQYDGAFVGTMNFGSLEGEKPVNIAANAVTDLLVTTTFSPDKWQIMELTAEYYEGKLEFVISSQSTIKVPAIDYTFTTKVEGMKIKIGSFGDRHLCACPLWG